MDMTVQILAAYILTIKSIIIDAWMDFIKRVYRVLGLVKKMEDQG